ncbi:MAG: sigma-E factor negative regulatory protein [Burkholderiales bacterium]
MADDSQRLQLSAFMDGEGAPEACSILVGACAKDARLNADWETYHCIGDVLRSADMGCHSEVLTARVMESLAGEPSLMAPTALSSAQVSHQSPDVRARPRWLSVAAAAAAVAVIGGVVYPQWSSRLEQVAVTSPKPATAPAAAALPRNPEAPVRVSGEYLAAHRQYSAGMVVPAAESR